MEIELYKCVDCESTKANQTVVFFLYSYTYCIVLYLNLQRNANVVELQSKVVCAHKQSNQEILLVDTKTIMYNLMLLNCGKISNYGILLKKRFM